jgi:hypothetical protein
MPRQVHNGGADLMETRVDEIADDIYRLSTYVPEIAAPAGFTFNQFVVKADEPLLFHCGPRQMFPLVSEAAARVVPLDQFRWITFGHVESDECGSMNDWLAVAPNAEVAHGAIGCLVSTSAGSASATSTRRTSRTTGRRVCSTRRRPTPC